MSPEEIKSYEEKRQGAIQAVQKEPGAAAGGAAAGAAAEEDAPGFGLSTAEQRLLISSALRGCIDHEL